GFSDELADWSAIQDQILSASDDARHWSATALANSVDGRPGQDGPDRRDDPDAPVGSAASTRPPEPTADDRSEVEGGQLRDEWRIDGAGAALGTAVHAALELVDFDDPGDLGALAGACAAAEGIPELGSEVESRLRAALAAPSIELARSAPHWRELYVAIPAGSGTVEGFVDLCVETDDGLVVVDYKTDELAGADAVAGKVRDYRIQGATYAVALEHITAKPVVACRFVFIGPDGVVESDIDDLDSATSEVRQLLKIDESP
ncbi:MAG: PD-(D/E)XK nuclease family protein, partial [Acidimicrobiales bacterium]